jgi:hypothetical protein
MAFCTSTTSKAAALNFDTRRLPRAQNGSCRDNHSFDVRFGHGWKERQCNNLSTDSFSYGKHAFLKATLAIQGEQVNGGVVVA